VVGGVLAVYLVTPRNPADADGPAATATSRAARTGVLHRRVMVIASLRLTQGFEPLPRSFLPRRYPAEAAERFVVGGIGWRNRTVSRQADRERPI
jgi:hypothetical protein